MKSDGRGKIMIRNSFSFMVGAALLAVAVCFSVSCDEEPPGNDSNQCVIEAFTPVIGSDGTYGGSQTDAGTAIKATRDGGFVVAGYTWELSANMNLGPTNYWVMKFDRNRSLVWSKVYGLAGREYPYGVYETADNGVIVVGHKRLQEGDHLDYYGTYHDFWILRLDPEGNLLWEKTYGGRGYEVAYAVQQTQTGGYLVAGVTTSYGISSIDTGLLIGLTKKNLWVMNLAPNGDILWEYVHGGLEEDGAYGVQETREGHILVAGYESSVNGNGDYNCLVVKLTGSGEKIWEKSYGGPYPDTAYAIREAADGAYILAGDTWSYGNGNTDSLIIKTDPDGNELWSTTFGGEKFERVHALREMPDGAMVAAGYTSSYGAGGNDGLVLKLSASGNILWHKVLGWEGYDMLFAVDLDLKNEILLTGATSSRGAGQLDLWLMALDQNGDAP